MKHSKAYFATVCRMTCLGGSETGTCPCKRPYDCTAAVEDPNGFLVARREAVVRMGRHLANTLADQAVKK